MYHHENELEVGKAAKVTVVAAFVISEKARIYAQFAQYVDSSVCKIQTLYDNCSLL